MKTLNTLKLCTLAAACCLAAPLIASTPDGETPANEGVCDDLMADGVTKGLYGLCVAFCEAQDCEAEDDGSGNITFGENCKASNPKILDNYNKKRDAENPLDVTMPCVNVAANECICWTEAELDTVADYSVTKCEETASGISRLIGKGTETRPNGQRLGEFAQATVNNCRIDFSDADGNRVIRVISFETEEDATVCKNSIAAECASRGF